MSIRCALAATALLAAPASAQFWLTGAATGANSSRVTALSQSGAMAAGHSSQIPGSHAVPGFTWTAAGGRDDFGLLPGMPSLSAAQAMSSDGAVVVGYMDDPTSNYPLRAFRRVGNGPVQNLGIFPGHDSSYATGVSGDGSIVVGNSDYMEVTGYWGEAFRWTPSGGLQGLGYYRPEHIRSEALAISRNGSTIVGSGFDIELAPEALKWNQATGWVALAPFPGQTYNVSRARGVNALGNVIVGDAEVNGDPRAVRWTPGGIQYLGTLPQSSTSFANAVSDDGHTIGGRSGVAFVWTPQTGMISLADFLSSYGISVPSNVRLETIYAISGDGMTFGGLATTVGTNITQGFVAHIPAPATALLLVLAPILAPRPRRTIR
jgi:uncharacterized membrane protein